MQVEEQEIADRVSALAGVDAEEVEPTDVEQEPQPEEPPTDEQEPREAPDYEAIAREQGWRPFDEYGGDESKWVDAAEFVRRGPLLEEIKKRGNETKELRDSIDAMKAHNAKIMEALRKQQVGDLMTKRREAIEAGDAESVETLDRQIYETDQAYRQKEPDPPKQPDIPPEIESWKGANPWFDEDPDLQKFAVSYFGTLDQNDIQGSLDKTAEAVRRAFPDKFENPNRRRAPAVETQRRMKQTPKGLASLPKDVQDVAPKLIRIKVMTEAEYMEQYQEINNA